MSGVTAQELAIRTAITSVADTGTLLQKVNSPGRLYEPVTKAQLVIDMDLNPTNWNTAYGWGNHAGLYDATGTAATAISGHESTYNHSNYNAAYNHISADGKSHADVVLNNTHRALVAGNPHVVTRAELNLAVGDTPTFAQVVLSNSPSNNSHGVTKAYADALYGGAGTFWSNVCLATTAAIDLSTDLEAGDTIDGITLVAGDRILVKDQTNAEENGLYVASASGVASRATDADTAEEVENRKCIILNGAVNVNKFFFCITTSIILETTPIQFGELASSGQQGVVELIGQEYETGGTWESPTSYTDVESNWNNETNAYDSNTGTYADIDAHPYNDWNSDLIFYFATTKISKFRVYAKKNDVQSYALRGSYYDGTWHLLNEVSLTTSPGYHTFDIGSIKSGVTAVKIECNRSGPTDIRCSLYEVEIWDVSTTAQYITTLRAGTPTADYTLVFPDDNGVANNVMISEGSGVLSWVGDVTQWDTAYGWGNHVGLYDATGTAAGLLAAFTGTSSIVTLGTIATGTWNGTTIAIANGGTGQTTAQAAIDALTAVAGATNEYVLTKDTATGNAIFKVASGGGTFTGLSDTPANFTGSGGKTVKVNSGETALEFVTVSGGGFTDRGDPVNPDWTHATLTIDGAYHDLDCSSIVPSGAVAIGFTCYFKHTTVQGKAMLLRKNGNSNSSALVGAYTYLANQTVRFNGVVACDANRVVEYYIESGVSLVGITVCSWFT